MSQEPPSSTLLVRYNPEGDRTMNQRQTQRLKRLSDYLHRTQRLFLFELLVPAEFQQLEHVDQNKGTYDTQLRPRFMVQAIQDLRHAGVEPSGKLKGWINGLIARAGSGAKKQDMVDSEDQSALKKGIFNGDTNSALLSLSE